MHRHAREGLFPDRVSDLYLQAREILNLASQLTSLCLGCLAAWLPGCLAAWLPGCLAAWLPGCLAAWLPGCMAGHPPASPAAGRPHSSAHVLLWLDSKE